MIYNKVGEEFIYDGVIYRVGSEIVGSGESDYRGLNGFILEIRTDDDKETENETPDIHCYFDPPCLPIDIEDFEKRFSTLYGSEKKLEDIPLDYVIMAPEEIIVLSSPRKNIEVYVLEEDWAADDNYGHSTAIYADYHEAKAKLNAILQEEMNIGCLTDWLNNENYQFDTDENSYESWLDGFYDSSHYRVAITKSSVQIQPSICECKEIVRLKDLLYNAINHIAETTDFIFEHDPYTQMQWYKDTLDITANELKSIGLNWFDEVCDELHE